MSVDGLTTVKSSRGPAETLARLQSEVKQRGLTLFAHIDHAGGAAAVGMDLRPTDLLIVGGAKGGTPLMQSAQTIGVDLPMKLLVWQDAGDVTWVSYEEPAWLAARHAVGEDRAATVAALGATLKEIAAAATAA